MKTKIGALMVIALFILSIFPAVFAENDAERVEPSSVEKKMVDAELTELFTTGEKSQKPRMIRTTSLKKTEVYQKASPVINAKEVTSIGMVEKVGTFNKIQSQLSSNIAESFEDATEEIGSSPNHVTLYVANGITVEVIYRHGVFAGEVEIDTDVAPESAWSPDVNKMWGRYT
ncbi:MAG: hypothetical protein Q8Q42_03540 [Nanoarchaeota archaeon]|nr:hypothetical protein [Nanoarchaeota archaeon]